MNTDVDGRCEVVMVPRFARQEETRRRPKGRRRHDPSRRPSV